MSGLAGDDKTLHGYDSTSVKRIEIPASLSVKLSEKQLEELEQHANKEGIARHDLVLLEHAMEKKGMTYEDAFRALKEKKLEGASSSSA